MPAPATDYHASTGITPFSPQGQYTTYRSKFGPKWARSPIETLKMDHWWDPRYRVPANYHGWTIQKATRLYVRNLNCRELWTGLAATVKLGWEDISEMAHLFLQTNQQTPCRTCSFADEFCAGWPWVDWADENPRGLTLGAFGGVAGFFALFFFSDIPRVRKDILIVSALWQGKGIMLIYCAESAGDWRSLC